MNGVTVVFAILGVLAVAIGLVALICATHEGYTEHRDRVFQRRTQPLYEAINDIAWAISNLKAEEKKEEEE